MENYIRGCSSVCQVSDFICSQIRFSKINTYVQLLSTNELDIRYQILMVFIMNLQRGVLPRNYVFQNFFERGKRERFIFYDTHIVKVFLESVNVLCFPQDRLKQFFKQGFLDTDTLLLHNTLQLLARLRLLDFAAKTS